MKKIMQKIVAFLTAFIIFVFGASFMGTIITSEGYVKHIVANSNYVTAVEAEIADKMYDIAIPSGLPEEFFNNKIKTDYLKEEINICIERAIKGENYEYSNQKIVDLIYKDIEDYAIENNIEINDESKGMLKETATEGAKYYENFTYKLFYKILGYINGASKLLLIVSLVLLAVVAVMVFVLYRSIDLSYAALGGGLMLVVPGVMFIKGSLFKLSIASKAVLGFVNAFIGYAIGILMILGVVFIALGLLNLKFLSKPIAKRSKKV